jgi:hypothetical protein
MTFNPKEVPSTTVIPLTRKQIGFYPRRSNFFFCVLAFDITSVFFYFYCLYENKFALSFLFLASVFFLTLSLLIFEASKNLEAWPLFEERFDRKSNSRENKVVDFWGWVVADMSQLKIVSTRVEEKKYAPAHSCFERSKYTKNDLSLVLGSLVLCTHHTDGSVTHLEGINDSLLNVVYKIDPKALII